MVSIRSPRLVGSLPSIATLIVPTLTIVLPSYIVATMLTHSSIHRISACLSSIIELEELPCKVHPVKLVDNALVHVIDRPIIGTVAVVVLWLLLSAIVLAAIIYSYMYKKIRMKKYFSFGGLCDQR